MPWRAFDAAWFTRHQRGLLWLLNAPLLGRWFRWVLCLRPGDVGYSGRILRLYPHAVIVAAGRGRRRAGVRTHPKFAKRIYYAFRPLWWTLHAWDWAIADRLAPALSFGFATLTAYPDPGNPGTTTCDAEVVRASVNETWATIRAGAGTGVDLYTSSLLAWPFRFDASGTSNQWAAMSRAIFAFDTASIGSGATISDASLSLYGTAKVDQNSASPDVDVYGATPGDPTAIAASDFSQIGTSSFTGGAPISIASWNAAGYNVFTFDATGRAAINSSGVSSFGTRNANYDVANSAPSWGGATFFSGIQAYFADQTGTSEDPKLEVTFEAAVPRLTPVINQNRISAVANFTNSASTSLAFSSAVSSGQLLTCIVTLGSSAANVSTITDSVNTAGKWLRAISQRSTVANSSLATEIWYAPNSSAGTPTVTVTLGSTAAGRCLFGIQSWSLASTISTAVLGATASTAGNSSNCATPSFAVSSASVVLGSWKTSAGVANRTNPSGWSTLAPQNSTRENSFYRTMSDTATISTKWQVQASAQYVVALAEFRGSTFTPLPGTASNELQMLGVQ